jgi:hypothetical protein
MQENKSKSERPLVIVRAWGDEPVTLSLHRIDNNRCYVGSENASRPIGLPSDQVLKFDVNKFSTLRTSFQQGDARKLGELWANMALDDFSCNKYQDNVSCSHDQEHFSDSESNASSHGE